VTALKSCESTPNTTYNDNNRRRVNRVKPDTDERLELEELERMYAEWGHEAPEPTALHSAHGGTINSTNTRPSSPTPAPCLRDTPSSTQYDHVTMLEHCLHPPNNRYDDDDERELVNLDNNTIRYQANHTTHNYLDTLLQLQHRGPQRHLIYAGPPGIHGGFYVQT
jgi:hypothetical protein